MLEVASAADTIVVAFNYAAGIDEAITSADVPDATVVGALTARHAMLANVFVNSNGTSRDANADGIMANL